MENYISENLCISTKLPLLINQLLLGTMRILFATTVDASFSALFVTWLSYLLHALSTDVVKNASTDIQYSLAVGCMPSAYEIADGRKADRNVSLLNVGVNCTYIKDIDGFQADVFRQKRQYFVYYPNVRRMMMVKAFAATGQYDMIVYSDLDALVVRSPVSDLLQYWSNNYSAVFTRSEYNLSVICNGFYALNDMSLPKHWLQRGVYSQNDMNNWIKNENKEKRDFYTSYQFQHPNGDGMLKLGLLPEPDYYRGGCGTDIVPTRKVEHCNGYFFNGKTKLEAFQRLGRLIAAPSEVEQRNVSQILATAIELSGSGTIVSDFVYKRRDEKLSKPTTYKMELFAHKLKLSADIIDKIQEFPRWKNIQRVWSL